jgi:SAM-dependent methyltransferase
MSIESLKQALLAAGVRQFGNPRGVAGRMAGWVMAHRSSNRRRNRWVVSVLDVQPSDRVLEIGFGPGRAVAELSRRIGPSGHIDGVDRSHVMLRQATRRNAAAIRSGRMTLTQGAVERLPPELGGPYDAIFAVNSLGFWTDAPARLADLRTRLAPGGRIAIASQPRSPGATRATSLDAARRLTGLLEGAGFSGTTSHLLELDPPAVCVVGVNPSAHEPVA